MLKTTSEPVRSAVAGEEDAPAQLLGPAAAPRGRLLPLGLDGPPLAPAEGEARAPYQETSTARWPGDLAGRFGYGDGAMNSRWSDADAQGKSELDLLVYASRLIGAETTLVVWGGGNTSVKRTSAITGTGRRACYA